MDGERTNIGRTLCSVLAGSVKPRWSRAPYVASVSIRWMPIGPLLTGTLALTITLTLTSTHCAGTAEAGAAIRAEVCRAGACAGCYTDPRNNGLLFARGLRNARRRLSIHLNSVCYILVSIDSVLSSGSGYNVVQRCRIMALECLQEA
ncbi:hypothetical protein J6590_022410 [Homalodisca vitripennis]|nr:hypothetical protein J6590_022410 [Homalodisca vitripennis]